MSTIVEVDEHAYYEPGVLPALAQLSTFFCPALIITNETCESISRLVMSYSL